jgi:hypothetical protein
MMSLTLSSACMITSYFQVNQEILAQAPNIDKQGLDLNVQVLNSGSADLIGSLHVMSATTGVVKNANDITFPAGQTLIKIFEFNQNEIPEGSNFSVEAVYGDDLSKIIHGINNQSKNGPEFISITIP